MSRTGAVVASCRSGLRHGWGRQRAQAGVPLVRHLAAHGRCALVITTPIFDSVDIAASVLPGVNELGSVLRRHGRLQVGPGGRHFFLIAGEGSSQWAAVGIGDDGTTQETSTAPGKRGGRDEDLIQVGLDEQPGHLIGPSPTVRLPPVIAADPGRWDTDKLGFLERQQPGHLNEAQVVADTDAEDPKPGLGDGEAQVPGREHVFFMGEEVGFAVVQNNPLCADCNRGVVQLSVRALAEAADDVSVGGGGHLAPGSRGRTVQRFRETLKNRSFSGVTGDGQLGQHDDVRSGSQRLGGDGGGALVLAVARLLPGELGNRDDGRPASRARLAEWPGGQLCVASPAFHCGPDRSCAIKSITSSSPQSRKAMQRPGPASPPSIFSGKNPMTHRVLSTASISPPMFSAWRQPDWNAKWCMGKMSEVIRRPERWCTYSYVPK